MKPNFALSLSFDGIRLLHRSGTGWTIVGDVPLDSPDLAGELAMLRKTALSLDPAGLRTKVLLPNDQIKYLALDTTRASEDDVRAALDGVTPYKVADLVYDFVKGAGRTYIAAVARETLDEAEAFAAEHRFAPVAFAGVPEEFTYLGEAFFGQTKASKTLLSTGDSVERDSSPVRVNAKATRPKPPAPASAPQPVTEVAPTDATTLVTDTPAASQKPSETAVAAPDAASVAVPAIAVPPVAVAESTSLAKSDDVSPAITVPDLADAEKPKAEPAETEVAAATKASEAVQKAEPAEAAAENSVPALHPNSENLPEPENLPQAESLPVFASRSRPLRAHADKTESLPPAKPLPSAIKDERVPPPAPSAPSSQERVEPVFTRRNPVIPALALEPTTTEPVAQLEQAAPVVTAAAAATQPVQLQNPVAGLAVPVSRDATGPALSGVGRVTIDSVGLAPRTGPATPPPPVASPAVTGMSGAAKPATTVAASIAPIRTAPFAPPASQNSASSLTVAPASPVKPSANVVPLRPPILPADAAVIDAAAVQRKQATDATMAKAAARPVRSRPRYLGLVLTLILLLVMAAVATWATVTDQSLSSWFGGTDETTNVAGVVAVPVAVPTPEAAAEETVLILPDATPPEAETQAEPLDEAALATPIIEEDLPENLAAVTEIAPTDDTLPPDATAAAAAAAAVAAAISAMPQDPAAGAEPLVEEAAVSPSLAEPNEPAGEGTAVSADEADRFYAATGVWLRAPRLPLTPQTEALDDLYTPGSDTAPTERDSALIASLGPDPGLTTQLNPPAPGTRFPRDDRGFILATPEGTLTPDGLMIFAGQPTVLPQNRPGTVAPVTEAAVASVDPNNGETPLDAADVLAITAPDMAAVTALLGPSWRPTTRPEARPESAAALPAALPTDPAAVDTALDDGTVAEAATDGAALPTDTETPADAATAGGVSLAGIRPVNRPDGIAPDLAAEAEPTLAAYDGVRPSTRPEGLAPEGADSSHADAVEEAPTADLSTTLASIVEGAADPLAGATAQAVAVASRPDSRPTNFSRVVEQQTARLQRAQPAAAAAIASAAPTAPASNASPEEQAETQPEIASSAAAQPSGPVPGGVAQAATLENAMALREINLIGVYGTQSARRALVRLANGRYVRVEVGDSLDGGQVTAISDSVLNYVKRGRTIALQVPQGG